MRKIILYSAISLDFKIARLDGGIDWLETPETIPGEDYGYKGFNESIDTTLMGNNTYRQILGFDVPFPYPDKTNYVFSKSGSNKNTEFVELISGEIIHFTRQLKNQTGKDIWLIGGGQINTLLLSHQLIDQMILTIIPATIGDGIPLFHPSAGDTHFTLEDSKTYKNGIIQLIYNKS